MEVADQPGDQLARSLGLPHQPLKILFGQVALIECHVELSPNFPSLKSAWLKSAIVCRSS